MKRCFLCGSEEIAGKCKNEKCTRNKPVTVETNKKETQQAAETLIETAASS